MQGKAQTVSAKEVLEETQKSGIIPSLLGHIVPKNMLHRVISTLLPDKTLDPPAQKPEMTDKLLEGYFKDYQQRHGLSEKLKKHAPPPVFPLEDIPPLPEYTPLGEALLTEYDGLEGVKEEDLIAFSQLYNPSGNPNEKFRRRENLDAYLYWEMHEKGKLR